jgi:hypothetical protein
MSVMDALIAVGLFSVAGLTFVSLRRDTQGDDR